MSEIGWGYPLRARDVPCRWLAARMAARRPWPGRCHGASAGTRNSCWVPGWTKPAVRPQRPLAATSVTVSLPRSLRAWRRRCASRGSRKVAAACPDAAPPRGTPARRTSPATRKAQSFPQLAARHGPRKTMLGGVRVPLTEEPGEDAELPVIAGPARGARGFGPRGRSCCRHGASASSALWPSQSTSC